MANNTPPVEECVTVHTTRSVRTMTRDKNMVYITEEKGFRVKLDIKDGGAVVVIEDLDRDATSKITGVAVILINKNDENIRIASDYKIKEI